MKIIIIFFINLFAINMFAENITGTVIGNTDDEKLPLNKATVRWLGSDKGTYTDINGHFTLEKLKSTGKLIISYIGYKNDTINVDKQINVLVELQSSLILDGITVTGKADQLNISSSDMVNTFKITGSGLRKAACCNLAESFVTNAAADVEYSDAVSGARQIRLLGLEGIYTQLLTENIPSMRGLSSIYGLGFIPGPWMSSISISKGTASVVNGFEGITGQINVEFKKPEDANPLFMNFFGDQFGRFEINTDYTEQINDKLSTMILAHGNLNQFGHDQNDDTFSDHPLISQINLFNRWKYHGESHESVSGFQFLYEDRKAGQIDFLNNANEKGYGINVQTTRLQGFTKNGFFVGTGNSSIGTILSFTYHKQSSIYGKRDFNAKQLSLYSNVFYDLPFGNIKSDEINTYQSSEEIESENYNQNIKFGGSFQYDNYIQKFTAYDLNVEELIPGIFTEYSFSGIQNLTLTVGVRADWHNEYGLFITPRIHSKVLITDNITWRTSFGKGSRTSYPLADYSSVMASSRKIVISEKLNREEAYNIGTSLNSDFVLFDIPFTLNVDFYRTWFSNQIVADYDVATDTIVFSNLKGDSYSNSFQIDLILEPFDFLTVNAAYRYNDVKVTYHGELLQKSLQSPHKYFMNFAFATKRNDWLIDFTINYNGKGRLPNTDRNPDAYKLTNEFEGYLTLHGQITRKFNGWEVYLGGENLTDYMQNNPIIAYNDPFGNYFDSSMIYGPTMGRIIYFGVRISNDIY